MLPFRPNLAYDMKRWTLATALVAVILFVLACNNEFYRLTSPPEFSWHVVLRKIYSIVAFALLGYLAARAQRERGKTTHVGRDCTSGVAAYSGLIEIAQFFAGSQEGLAWNAVDVVCGAIGGALGARIERALRERAVRS